MTKYKVSEVSQDITSSTTLVPEKKYGGWFAVNQGVSAAKIIGYDVQPGEGIDMRKAVPAGSMWGSPIQIIVGAGGLVRITRLQYMEMK